MTRALVTAIGGDVGQAVARALARHGVEIVGCDRDTLHTWTVGPFADFWFHAVPKAGDPKYVASLFAIANERECELVIPASETEIATLLGHPHVGAGPRVLVERFLDKWETAQACERMGLVFAKTRLTGLGYAKPRQKGSSEVITQEYLNGPEYTVALWVSRYDAQDIRTLALRRELRGGATYRCWYEPELKATQAAEAVARDYALAFGIRGSMNIQGRYVEGRGFVPFEVNPRFSSTASMRDTMGFSDVWWSVQEALGRQADPMRSIGRARGVRYWEERVQVGGEWR